MKLDGKTTDELLAMRQEIENTSENQQDGFNRFTRKAQKKIDAINFQIAHNIGEARKLAGKPVSTDGYSGRQTNRR